MLTKNILPAVGCDNVERPRHLEPSVGQPSPFQPEAKSILLGFRFLIPCYCLAAEFLLALGLGNRRRGIRAVEQEVDNTETSSRVEY
jgi:hypothetical protein